MSNVNNWQFANQLQILNTKVIEPQIKKVDEAQTIMDDPKYPWRDDDQKKVGQAKLVVLKQWLAFYLEFYKQGMTLINQHETLTNHLAKWYANWYDNISNEGKQETELMSSQADMLGEIFAEIYSELKSLNLDIKSPCALNLK